MILRIVESPSDARGAVLDEGSGTGALAAAGTGVLPPDHFSNSPLILSIQPRFESRVVSPKGCPVAMFLSNLRMNFPLYVCGKAETQRKSTVTLPTNCTTSSCRRVC